MPPATSVSHGEPAVDPRVAEIACLAGIAPWKRARLARMFRNAHGPIMAHSARGAVAAAKRRRGVIACWASRVPAGLEARAADAGVPLWWIEDGFIRSVGLGAALVQPCSLTLDSRRPHYDPRGPSDLEHMLETQAFAPEALARAERLIDRLRAAAITKYNLAGEVPVFPAGRRVILVPGQVERDRSVMLGGGGMTMAELLARVRAEEPDAYLVYKPHPDVVAGLRRGEIAAPQADRILLHADLAALLDRVDAVHTLTSLLGFEALVRGRDVIVHGQPFYAGWGLTRDRSPLRRRTRCRSLAELVAATLIAYPLYGDPETGAPCPPEQLITRLEQLRTAPAATPALRALAARLAAWRTALRG